MERAQVELGLGMQAKVAKRRQERGIRALAGKRHVHPVQRPVEAGRERVRDLDHAAHVLVPAAGDLLVVAVAEVEAELDVGRNGAAAPDHALEDAALHVRKPDRKVAFQHAELEVRVPLQGELVVRDAVQDPVNLDRHRGFVRRLHDRLVVERDEGADRRQGPESGSRGARCRPASGH
jgi:hypothetical protein